jgi:hypothetical protein
MRPDSFVDYAQYLHKAAGSGNMGAHELSSHWETPKVLSGFFSRTDKAS